MRKIQESREADNYSCDAHTGVLTDKSLGQGVKNLAFFFVVSEIMSIFATGVERIRSAEEALCSKLADGNVRNFQARLITAGGQNSFHV